MVHRDCGEGGPVKLDTRRRTAVNERPDNAVPTRSGWARYVSGQELYRWHLERLTDEQRQALELFQTLDLDGEPGTWTRNRIPLEPEELDLLRRHARVLHAIVAELLEAADEDEAEVWRIRGRRLVDEVEQFVNQVDGRRDGQPD
jgi:hypothetical protein